MPKRCKATIFPRKTTKMASVNVPPFKGIKITGANLSITSGSTETI